MSKKRKEMDNKPLEEEKEKREGTRKHIFEKEKKGGRN
jgi:hypothetical protein